jgi:UDP-GlcNAc:undecaprenyl-phosphate GlcNAc-1-phosphate transferase
MVPKATFDFAVVSAYCVLQSFLLVYFIVPKITGVIVARNLNEEPNHRSSHSKSTPSMGGISFFITLILALFVLQSFDQEQMCVTLIASCAFIFIAGLKDDLVGLSPKGKVGVLLIATFFIFWHEPVYEPNVYGFLGMNVLPISVYYALLALMVVTIVNAFNLIDGVDGLAATIGMVVFSVFALIFYAADMQFYFLLCLCFTGMLLAYMYYNFSSTKKIFMGDTGSLLIGFCIAFMALKFLSMEVSDYRHFRFKIENKIFVLIGILCVPLADTVRVMGVRLLQRKSPFYADRNHVHHLLIDRGMTHMKASLLLGFLNLIVILIVLWTAALFNSVGMLMVTASLFLSFILTFVLLKKTGVHFLRTRIFE